ncbi:MAG: exonuclease SbcCD subunit D [Bacteroidales bacterium]|nr:exonuclease SbcCD subunit D [Bacteroidales bacterium]
MKIIHTSDWHLGKRLGAYSRLPEQYEVCDEICRIADRENVHAVVVAGDLFDSFNPSSEAVSLLYTTLKRLSAEGTRAVIAIAGNHDSPDRIEAPDVLARECGIVLSGYPNTYIQPFSLATGLRILRSDTGFIEIKLPQITDPLRIILTPYANEYRFKTCFEEEDSSAAFQALLQTYWQQRADQYCDQAGINILLTHLFMVKKGMPLPEEPEEEKPILYSGGAQVVYTSAIPRNLHYTALGHLHKPHYAAKTETIARYAGSPLGYSFSESDQTKSVTLIETSPEKTLHISEIPLTKGKILRQLRATSVEEAKTLLLANPEALIELVLATPAYLTADERKELFATHDGIVAIIPDIRVNAAEMEKKSIKIDLTQNTETLFKHYFETQKGQPPNDEIMNLFREILAKQNG